MKKLKVTNSRIKKQTRFVYGRGRQENSKVEDPTIIIATTVTHIYPQG